MSSSQKRLKINVTGRNYLVWNASDVRRLREDCRIVGTLIGCLPRAPRQNVHLGLPLQLMKEEVTLLIEKELAEVVEEVYKESDVASFKHDKLESYKEQIKLFKQERRDEMKRKLPDIIAGKKRKRNKLLEDRRNKGEIIADEEFEKEIVIDPDNVEIPDIQEEQMLTQLHTVPLYRQTELRTVDWKSPQNEQEELMYRVYKHFWELGHFVTSGMKFGGDFLVYPGDPSRFHSFFIAVCKPYHEQTTALDIVTMGRLGTAVKKTCVMCSIDDKNNVCCKSLQWTSIS